MRVLGLAIAVFGAACLYEARSLSFVESYTIGPGAAPTIYASAIVALGAWMVLRGSGRENGTSIPIDRRSVGMLALTAAMALALEWLGVVIALFVFATTGFRLLSGMGMLRSIAAAALLVGGFYAIFVVGLHVPLPRGTVLPALLAAGSNG